MNKKELKRLARTIASDVLQGAIEHDGIHFMCEARELNLSEDEKLELEQAIYNIIMQLRGE